MAERQKFWRFHIDLWTEIAQHLEGETLASLAVQCSEFREIASQQMLWKIICLRKLQMPKAALAMVKDINSNWEDIARSLAGGRHCYSGALDNGDVRCGYIAFKRIGGIIFNSKEAVVTNVFCRRNKHGETIVEPRLDISDIRTGLWIVDCHIILQGRTCILDSRHVELPCYGRQEWVFEKVGTFVREEAGKVPFVGICQTNKLQVEEHNQLLFESGWTGKAVGPRTLTDDKTLHSVAVMSQAINTGLATKVYVMIAAPKREIVDIRIAMKRI